MTREEELCLAECVRGAVKVVNALAQEATKAGLRIEFDTHVAEIVGVGPAPQVTADILRRL